MIRVTLGGDLAGFTSLGFDDHIKLFFPQPPAPSGEPQTASRDYTPRCYDPVANTLEIEFVLHDAGPATSWAEQVQPGQSLQIGGPRGSAQAGDKTGVRRRGHGRTPTATGRGPGKPSGVATSAAIIIHRRAARHTLVV